jgi:outer membrane protein TolC
LALSFFIGSSSFALTLKEAIDSALKNNPGVLAQAERIKAVEGEVGQASSGFLPQLSLEGKLGIDYRTPISYDVLPGTSFTLYPDETASVTGLRAVLSQNVYTGGRLDSRVEIVRLKREIAKEELKRKKQELVFEVASNYYGVSQAKKLLELSKESVEVTKAHLNQVKTYFNVGSVSRSDLLRAQVSVSENKLRKIKNQSELEIAKIKLNDVLGRDIKELVEIFDYPQETSARSLPTSAELLNLAYENRSEWMILGLQEKVGEGKVKLARAGHLPNFVLYGTASKNITNYSSASIKYDVNSWNVFGMLSWTAFDGLNTQNQIKEAQANLAEVQVFEKQTKNRIAAEVKEAELHFNSAKQRIKSANEEVKFADENLEQALEEYRRGVKSNIEYLEARRLLNNALAHLLSAETDLELAKARTNLAVGKPVFSIY